LIRIYAPSDVYEDYIDAVQIDEIARNRARKWDVDSRDLMKSPPVVRFIAPKNSRYKPTRSSTISGFIARRNPSSTSGFFGLERISSPILFEKNVSLLRSFGELGREHSNFGKASIMEYTSEEVLKLLNQWGVEDSEGMEFQTFKEMLTYDRSEGGISEERIKFAIDNSIMNIEWSFDQALLEIENRIPLDWDYKRNNDPQIPSNVWKEKSGSYSFGLHKVRTLVGGNERALKDNFTDDYLIHARLFALWANQDEEGRSFHDKPFGIGISLIGWTPKNEFEYWAHGQVNQIDE